MNAATPYPAKHYRYHDLIYSMFKYPKFRLTIFKNFSFVKYANTLKPCAIKNNKRCQLQTPHAINFRVIFSGFSFRVLIFLAFDR